MNNSTLKIRDFLGMVLVASLGLWLSSLILPNLFAYNHLKDNGLDILLVAFLFTASFYIIGSRIKDDIILFGYNALILYIISVFVENFTIPNILSLLVVCFVISLLDYLLPDEK